MADTYTDMDTVEVGKEKLQAELLPSDNYVPSDAPQTGVVQATPVTVTGENIVVLAEGGECDCDPGLLCADTCNVISESCTCQDMGDWGNCEPFEDNKLENMSKAWGKLYIFSAISITFAVCIIILNLMFGGPTAEGAGISNTTAGDYPDTPSDPVPLLGLVALPVLLLFGCGIPLLSGCWMMCIVKRPEMCCCDRKCNAGVFTCLNMLTWYSQVTEFCGVASLVGACCAGAVSFNFCTGIFVFLQLCITITIMVLNALFSCFTFRSCLWICSKERRFMSKAEGQRSGVQLV